MAALRTALDALIGGQPVRIEEQPPPFHDRYGCLVAHIVTADGQSLQSELLATGLAMVKIAPSSTPSNVMDAWLALEAEARQEKLGIWRDHETLPKGPADANVHIGGMGLIEGRVVRVSSNDRYVYLNFGQDWRSDFTVRLRQKLLKKNGIEPGLFDGRTLRVRGFVQEARGPLIDVSHLKQIEVIP